MVTLDNTDIHDILMTGTADLLELMLDTNISDDAKANVVRPGRLQEDPTENIISVTIHPGMDRWHDEINKEDEGPLLHLSTYTIGGQDQYWWRRFIVKFDAFFTGGTRDESRRKMQLVFQRANHALITWDVAAETAKDDYGESAQYIQVRDEWMREGGGEGDFNWRGEIFFEVLTYMQPTDPSDL
jgi:hypothetical protein